MTALCQVNEAIPIQWDIFEPDGRAKKSGLVEADFSFALFKDGVKQSQGTVDAVLSSVSEISAPSGDYGTTATFTTLGRWRLLVQYREQLLDFVFQIVPVLPWNMPRGRTA